MRAQIDYKADCMNVGPNLARDCLLDWDYTGPACDQVVSDIVKTPDDIANICKRMNINKSSKFITTFRVRF